MAILHKSNDKTVCFWCPGCDKAHQVIIGGENAWGFNDNYDSPTFTPSYLTWRDPNPEALPEYDPDGEYRNGFRCHSFITDGKIQFLDDCTHNLRNQIVDLPDWPIGAR